MRGSEADAKKSSGEAVAGKRPDEEILCSKAAVLQKFGRQGPRLGLLPKKKTTTTRTATYVEDHDGD